jgi:hypothetical protein
MRHDRKIHTTPLKFHPDIEVLFIEKDLADMRFLCAYNNKEVSVYLDKKNRLGYMSKPYWEIYDGEDTDRFFEDDVEGLMKGIQEQLGITENEL